TQAGSHAHVIAKIEKSEAVDVLDDVLAETDAVMVARGDLGVEIGPALVPLVQKRIIQKALERGKPVVTATQMLETMVHSPHPTPSQRHEDRVRRVANRHRTAAPAAELGLHASEEEAPPAPWWTHRPALVRDGRTRAGGAPVLPAAARPLHRAHGTSGPAHGR